MRIIFLISLVAVVSCKAAFAQRNSINELRQMFDYDQKLPLDIREVGFRDSDGARIHDIHYASPKFGRVTAYLVAPEEIKHYRMKELLTRGRCRTDAGSNSSCAGFFVKLRGRAAQALRSSRKRQVWNGVRPMKTP